MYLTHLFCFRIGRSGRFGRKGNAINFVTNDDISHLKGIEDFYNTSIRELLDYDHM